MVMDEEDEEEDFIESDGSFHFSDLSDEEEENTYSTSSKSKIMLTEQNKKTNITPSTFAPNSERKNNVFTPSESPEIAGQKGASSSNSTTNFQSPSNNKKNSPGGFGASCASSAAPENNINNNYNYPPQTTRNVQTHKRLKLDKNGAISSCSEDDNNFYDQNEQEDMNYNHEEDDNYSMEEEDFFFEEAKKSRKFSKKKDTDISHLSLEFPGGVHAEMLSMAQEVCSLISICSVDEALIMLKEYKFHVQNLTEAYFEDSDRVLKKVGLTLEGASSNHHMKEDHDIHFDHDRVNKMSSVAGNSVSSSSSSSTASSFNNVPTKTNINEDQEICTVCFDEDNTSFFSLPCGHRFCVQCWGRHLSTEVGEGVSCLNAVCMEPKCNERVRWGYFQKFCGTEISEKAKRFASKSFVELCARSRWCPTPDCPSCVLVAEDVPSIEDYRKVKLEESVEVEIPVDNNSTRDNNRYSTNNYDDNAFLDRAAGGGNHRGRVGRFLQQALGAASTSNYGSGNECQPVKKTVRGINVNEVYRDFSCKNVFCETCKDKWCFVCKEESHRGINCVVVKKWVEKNLDEAENMTWIMANTKPCPKCSNPIEKNQGCMHMVCRCGHQFCWLCLEDDFNYKHTRDGRPCNKYLEKPDEETEKTRKNLARYAHYFERYRSHDHAQKLAAEQTLARIRARMEDLQKVFGSWNDVVFLEDAIQQVVECRRMLKWTYAFGYFMRDETNKVQFFEFQQGQLEQKVDQLQGFFESRVEDFCPSSDTEQLVFEDQQSTTNEQSLKITNTSIISSSSSSPLILQKLRGSFEDGQANIHSRMSEQLSPEELEERRERFQRFKSETTNLTTVTAKFFSSLTDFFEKQVPYVDFGEQSSAKKKTSSASTSSRPSTGGTNNMNPWNNKGKGKKGFGNTTQ